jgi:hypothetical protein
MQTLGGQRLERIDLDGHVYGNYVSVREVA